MKTKTEHGIAKFLHSLMFTECILHAMYGARLGNTVLYMGVIAKPLSEA